jgi:MFS family permease
MQGEDDVASVLELLMGLQAFAGIGGGGMTTVVSILISDIVPLRERGKWQGYLNIVYATGSATGAPLGGHLHFLLGCLFSTTNFMFSRRYSRGLRGMEMVS